LAETIADWEGRDRNAFCVNSDLMHTLRCRSLEIDIEELEGAPNIEAARTQTHQDFRFRGRRPAESTVVERPKSILQPGSEPSELPTPIDHPFVDRLAPYRGDPTAVRIEPTFT
jgi:hypothetical protein